MDQGYYQCRASNSYGTAVSPMVHLQQAVIGVMYGPTEPRNVSVLVGRPYTIRCDVPRCIPPPSISWTLRDLIDAGSDRTRVQTSERVQIDEFGLFDNSFICH